MVFRYENFEYIVENGGVNITGIINDSHRHFLIPKSIKSLPIIKVSLDMNKYVILERFIYKIKYNICNDFAIYDDGYIIDGQYFKNDFNAKENIITKLLNGDIPSIVGYQISWGI